MPKQFGTQHKTEIVRQLLRDEDIELVSREVDRTAAELSRWKEAFLAADSEGPKKRPEKDEAEIKQPNEKVGEQTMEIKLL